MIANPRQRIVAGLLDLGWFLAWAVVVAVVLLAVHSALRWGPFDYHLAFLLAVVLPATVAFTALEAGRYEATPGKLKVGLRVRRDPSGDRIGPWRSASRSLLKFGLPWALAQSGVLAVITAPAPDALVGCLVAALVPVAYLISLFLGSGRTVYDWLTNTEVIAVSAGRRFAPVAEEPAAEEATEQGAAPKGPGGELVAENPPVADDMPIAARENQGLVAPEPTAGQRWAAP